MTSARHPAAFWIIAAFLVFDLLFLLTGQTASLFAYDWTVRAGLQESAAQITEHGVRVNRAYGVSDTVVYVPLIAIALIGLIRRRRWALIPLAAVCGISIYWPVTVAAMMLFHQGTDGYHLAFGPGYTIVFALFIVFGAWGLAYLATRGHRLHE